MAKDSLRYKTEEIMTVAKDLVDGALTTFTGGLISRIVDVKEIDTKTGETNDGSGYSRKEAKNNAHSKFPKK